VAYDEKAVERVRRILARRRGVVERKMMGGVCFMVGGNMCVGVSASSLMVRVGSEAYPALLARPQVRPLEFAGRRPRGFVLIDPPGWRTEASLRAWVQRALDFIATLPPRKGARRGR
jgi:TfoX/Sxy family transcriptional regulator of competence genes